MKITLIIAIVLAVFLSFNVVTQASAKALKAPSMFDKGPAAITAIKLKADEVASLVLLEGVMSLASSAVLAGSCQSLEGKYSVAVTTDGAINKPETNVAKIISSVDSKPLVLNATIEAPDSFLGQSIKIRQVKNSKLKETLISEYTSVATINSELTLLSLHSNANIPGQNNIQSPYQNLLIKHFYQEPKSENKTQHLLGWGAASLSKAGFPVSQFWLRFKALTTNGQVKRVVFQQDQLIGASSCRIVIDSAIDIKKENEKEKQESFVLKGMMMIMRSKHYEDLPLLNGF